MLLFLSILSGIFIAVMIAQNGDLGAAYGNYHATLLIHVVGLCCILLWMLARREKIRLDRSTPFIYLLGGAFGVGTVVLNNLCFWDLGVSLTLALGLLGQCMAGGLVDHFGWFGLPKRPFQKQHLLSFFMIAAGIAVMMLL